MITKYKTATPPRRPLHLVPTPEQWAIIERALKAATPALEREGTKPTYTGYAMRLIMQGCDKALPKRPKK